MPHDQGDDASVLDFTKASIVDDELAMEKTPERLNRVEDLNSSQDDIACAVQNPEAKGKPP